MAAFKLLHLKRAFTRARTNLARYLIGRSWIGDRPFVYLTRRIEEIYLRRSIYRLFDRDFYLASNPNLAGRGVNPLRHYIRQGDREKRDPGPFFSREYYLKGSPAASRAPVTALTHFLLKGRPRRISPTPYFDYRWYISANPDVAIAHMEPFRHFLRHGLKENRDASALFCSADYLSAYPDVVASGIPALEHFLKYGRAEGRRALSLADSARLRQPSAIGREFPTPPDDIEAAILALAPSGLRDHAKLNVVVPVYKGKDETLSCLLHLLKSKNETPFEVIVVDDASPEPELSAALKRLAEKGYFRLLINEQNRGFVTSVNRGMQCDPEHDVILLNSDTEVYGNWIDRLRNHAHADQTIGTITPLTNNGTICAYPRFCEDNDGALELAHSELDVIAATVNKAQSVEAPSGVGFCIYIRRAAINAVGLFDEDAFGRGYGEENDFCQRAQQAGFKDIIASDVFVRHLGSTSFGGEKIERIAEALGVIDQRYPGYQQGVRRFIAADPLREARAQLDLARLKRFSRKQNILIICHGRGGGTEQHVQEEARRLERDGAAIFRMQNCDQVSGRVIHIHEKAPDVPNLPALNIVTDREKIIELWRDLGICEVHVHHVCDFGQSPAADILKLLTASGLAYHITVHDYFSICPRINLSGTDGFYCGEPDPAGCRKCLKRNGSEYGEPDIQAWREAHKRLLDGATSIVTPSHDAAKRLRRYFEALNIEVRAHEDVKSSVIVPKPNENSSRPLRVGTLGAISPIKGFNTLVGCAKDARAKKLPLEFVVIGYTSDDTRARDAGIEVTGPYANSDVVNRIAAAKLDILWLASTWPETWSYTLSLALQTGLPIAAFDIGAIAERLARVPDRAILLPLALARTPAKLNSTLIEHSLSRSGHSVAGAII